MLTDIHTHLYHFTNTEIKNIIDKSLARGIQRIITCVHNRNTLIKTIPILKEYKNVYISIGVHPQVAFVETKEYGEFILIMEKTIDAAVAVGEIGYDNYPGNPPLESQKKAFIKQIEMVKQKDLPLIIHCRKAFDELFQDMQKSEKVILHSYSGGFKYLDIAIKKDFYISFSGTLTFKRSRRLKKIASLIPLNRILCETDTPFIPPETEPVSLQSKPEHLDLVFQSLVEAREEEEEEIKEALMNNVSSLFDFKRIDRNREKWIKLLEDSLKELRY